MKPLAQPRPTLFDDIRANVPRKGLGSICSSLASARARPHQHVIFIVSKSHTPLSTDSVCPNIYVRVKRRIKKKLDFMPIDGKLGTSILRGRSADTQSPIYLPSRVRASPPPSGCTLSSYHPRRVNGHCVTLSEIHTRALTLCRRPSDLSVTPIHGSAARSANLCGRGSQSQGTVVYSLNHLFLTAAKDFFYFYFRLRSISVTNILLENAVTFLILNANKNGTLLLTEED